MSKALTLEDSLAKLLQTVARLRDPQEGCPWDLKQTHQSLRKYMIEEAYEAAQAMSSAHSGDLCEELGDVLLQILLHSQIASEKGTFTLNNVIEGLDAKLVRRHPHVFAQKDGEKLSDAELKIQWQKIKAAEKAAQGKNCVEESFGEAAWQGLEPLLKVEKIGLKAAQQQFDWPNAESCFRHLESELEELREALSQAEASAIYAEMSDLYFTLGQLARKLGLSPSEVAEAGNQKFLSRLQKAQTLAQNAQDHAWTELTAEAKERYWSEAKKAQK